MSGRPRPLILSELPRPEARAVFEEFVSAQPQRLQEFLDEVRRRGGPAERLDRSLDSLDALWDWVVAEHPRGAGGTPFAGVTPPAGPWWQPFHPQWAAELGPYLAWLVTGFAEYFAACAVAASPESRWVMGRGGRASAHFQHPVLQIPGRGEMTYTVPIVTALRWLGDQDLGPHRPTPRQVLEIWLGLDAEHEARLAELARPLPDYLVQALDGERFTHSITFDDAVAHGQQRRVACLLDALREIGEIETAHQEDREVLLVRAPALGVAELEAIVAGIWSSRPGGSHGDASPDVG